MFEFGQQEIEAFEKVARSGQLFRYCKDGQCGRFEERFAEYIGTGHARLTASGTLALTAALAGVGVGPGDEVIVPGHTYIATALAVLAVGAIPVIVDIDESIMISPDAVDDAAGPRTRAVMPVHMWGAVCDMEAIMKVAAKHDLIVVEDCAQCVGGAFEGRMVGSFGKAAGFSFNYYKNITCGEGGAAVSSDGLTAQRIECFIDPCAFYWTGRREDSRPFCSTSARASEFEGAILNAQLDRLPAMLQSLRQTKKTLIRAAEAAGLTPAPARSIDHECCTTLFIQFEEAQQAQQFAEHTGAGIAGNTGRHTYNEWDPILERRGSHHPALDPFTMPQNKGCRMNYSKDMLPRTLDILGRTAMIGLRPYMTDAEVADLVAKLEAGAREALS